MARPLMIVESPAKAKTIEKLVGRRFKVEASVGHVRDLPKSQFGVDVENDFEPKYITIRGKGKVLSQLRKEVKQADRVVLATDPDREGEAISWHLVHALDLNKDHYERIAFHEVTKEAIQRALESPRGIDENLVDAYQARRVLDRIVGYRLSPLLWRKVRRGLSAGRVQSLALRLIVDREAEIEAFDPEEYWSLTAQFGADDPEDGQPFEAKYHRHLADGTLVTTDDDEEETDRLLPSEDAVNNLLEQLENRAYHIEAIRRRERKRNPAPAFTTSSLQQDANRRLGFRINRTMRVAQQLYEGLELGSEGSVGLITYIRTDSTRIAQSAMRAAAAYVGERFGREFVQPRGGGASDGAQDAHEGIRPTDIFRHPNKVKQFLSRDQHRLYSLIWQRFMASQMSAAVLDTLSVDILTDDRHHLFRATGSRLKFAGWMELYRQETGEIPYSEAPLPDLKEGQDLLLHALEPQQHFTQPPARYSEASLVSTLEEEGVGRPSTYASIIGTLQDRGYVTVDGRRFVPTDLGTVVTELLRDNFPEIVDVGFTARLEEKLDEIEDGGLSWREVLGEFHDPFEKRLEAANEMDRVRLPEKETDEKCEKCGKNLVIKHGRYGKFLACPGFPDCRFTKPFLEKVGVNCPDCGGEMVERKSRKGRTFYGCSEYPECEFVSWQKPLDETCPQCNAFLVEKRSKRRGRYHACARESCSYTAPIGSSSRSPAGG